MKTLKAPKKKKPFKVACVGAGPASLACAAKLAQEGYQVTIFEEQEKAGGVLTYGITPSRLPEHVVAHDIKMVKDLGVKFVFNTKVGRDVDLDEMGFDAIFIGAGLWAAKLPDIPGVDKEGVWTESISLRKARLKRKNSNPVTMLLLSAAATLLWIAQLLRFDQECTYRLQKNHRRRLPT